MTTALRQVISFPRAITTKLTKATKENPTGVRVI